MAAPPIPRLSTRRFAWVLWVMLLLPVAQAAALWHSVSHAAQAAQAIQPGTPTPDEPLSQPAHCDLCLLAASIHGGALPSAPIPLPHPTARHEAPLTAFAASWQGSPAHPYRSRAPPASSL
ncbi:hypothetical protein ACQ858_05745 [Variovorax ureilyticus]|uniref:hypothetical protein n=1 Tax=Variovorax ureilyticus TaxID=1836198 RepID=UPI003D67CCC6